MLAPAAGVTDSITRGIARKWGADATVTELVSSEGLIRNCKKTKTLMEFSDIERPLGIQLFGANPDNIAKAAEIASMLSPDFIDLNFGCPVKKITGKNGGSSLLKDLKTLEKIVTRTVGSTDLPVTIKYRSGWDDDCIVAVEVAQIAESNGIAAICLHPRTRMQGFAGFSDWSLIAKVKQAVKIPVIGSGDIDCPEKAKQMFDQTGCDSIMICRASFGNPWIFQQVKHYLLTGEIMPQPDINARINTALGHLHLSIEKYGPFNGLVRMRSQLCWYLKGMPGVARIRSKLVTLPGEADIKKLLENYKQQLLEQDYGPEKNTQTVDGCKIG